MATLTPMRFPVDQRWSSFRHRTRTCLTGANFFRRQNLIVLFALFIASWVSIPAHGASDNSTEFAIKAAFILKFGNYVDWPESAGQTPDTPFVIGVLGQDPFGAILDEVVANRTVQGRPVVVRRYKRVDQAREAQLLYVALAEKERRKQTLTALAGAGTLTITDSALTSAGMINFLIQDSRVRFEIDADAADAAGLKISSKLLSLAKVVNKNAQ